MAPRRTGHGVLIAVGTAWLMVGAASPAIAARPLLAASYLSLEVGSSNRAIVSVDLNHDGAVDAIMADEWADDVNVLLGRGDGSFAVVGSIPTGLSPCAVIAVDLDGDGEFDLAVANRGSATISILRGNGDGSFGPKTDLSCAAGPRAVAAADLNSDGAMDLVVACDLPAVSVFHALGGGAFAPRVDVSMPSVPRNLAVGDMDGDGRPDVVVTFPALLAFGSSKGNGDGTLGPVVTWPMGVAVDSVAVADLNDDGRPDLVFSAVSGVVVTLATTDGGFAAPTLYDVTGAAQGLTVADFDGDGALDVAVTQASRDQVVVLRGRGDGTLLDAQPAATDLTPVALVASDVNGDGKPDLLTSHTSRRLSVLLGNGDGTFGSARSFGSVADPSDVSVADLNADGRADVVASSGYYGTVSTYVGLGGGVFAPPFSRDAGPSPIRIALGDVNGDGFPDVVASDAFIDSVSVLLGTGTGTLAARVAMHSVMGPGPAVIADFDRDGRMDLAVGSAPYSSVGIHRGHGDGTFDSFVAYDVGPSPNAIVAVDLNGDHVLDLVSACVSARYVGTLFGRPDGSFEPLVTTTDPDLEEPRALAVGDFNGDGRPDVATIEVGSDAPLRIGLTGPDGLLSFAPFLQPWPFLGRSLACADFDADGHPDLAVTDWNHRVAILLGNGDGTFRQDDMDYGTPVGAEKVAVGDLDGDGLADLVVTSPFGGSWLRNIAPTRQLDVSRGREPQLSFAISPTPTRDISTLRFELPAATDLDVGVYDLLGRRIVTLMRGPALAGPHVVRWDLHAARGGRVPSGVYFASLRAGSACVMRRIVILE